MARQAIIKKGRRISWFIDGATYETTLMEGPCPLCYAEDTIVKLPPPLLARQPDDTTHVCVPALGGCNHGFALRGKAS